MMLSEWISLTKNPTIGEGEWDNVNIVYTWHPSMSQNSTEARQQCLKLYKAFGYGIFHDMVYTAIQVAKTQSCIDRTKGEAAMNEVRRNMAMEEAKAAYDTALSEANRAYNERSEFINSQFDHYTTRMNELTAPWEGRTAEAQSVCEL